MKHCPVCKNTYTDDSLSFCLNDGTPLASFYEPPETQLFPPAGKSTEEHQGRISIPINSRSVETKIVPSPVSPSPPPSPAAKGCSPLVIIGVIFLFGIFAVAGIIVAYFALKDDRGGRNDKPTPTPVFSPTSGSNSNEQVLKDKVDQLEKQLANQNKNTGRTPTPLPTPSSTQNSSGTTARVNSPGDGFLALRSGPDHKSGYQILKMPHGAVVNVYGCQGYSSVGGKSGRWCQVSYGGYSGWAFDAWLAY